MNKEKWIALFVFLLLLFQLTAQQADNKIKVTYKPTSFFFEVLGNTANYSINMEYGLFTNHKNRVHLRFGYSIFPLNDDKNIYFSMSNSYLALLGYSRTINNYFQIESGIGYVFRDDNGNRSKLKSGFSPTISLGVKFYPSRFMYLKFMFSPTFQKSQIVNIPLGFSIGWDIIPKEAALKTSSNHAVFLELFGASGNFYSLNYNYMLYHHQFQRFSGRIGLCYTPEALYLTSINVLAGLSYDIFFTRTLYYKTSIGVNLGSYESKNIQFNSLTRYFGLGLGFAISKHIETNLNIYLNAEKNISKNQIIHTYLSPSISINYNL